MSSRAEDDLIEALTLANPRLPLSTQLRSIFSPLSSFFHPSQSIILSIRLLFKLPCLQLQPIRDDNQLVIPGSSPQANRSTASRYARTGFTTPPQLLTVSQAPNQNPQTSTITADHVSTSSSRHTHFSLPSDDSARPAPMEGSNSPQASSLGKRCRANDSVVACPRVRTGSP